VIMWHSQIRRSLSGSKATIAEHNTRPINGKHLSLSSTLLRL
jgi:hypothetical protein